MQADEDKKNLFDISLTENIKISFEDSEDIWIKDEIKAEPCHSSEGVSDDNATRDEDDAPEIASADTKIELGQTKCEQDDAMEDTEFPVERAAGASCSSEEERVIEEQYGDRGELRGGGGSRSSGRGRGRDSARGRGKDNRVTGNTEIVEGAELGSGRGRGRVRGRRRVQRRGREVPQNVGEAEQGPERAIKCGKSGVGSKRSLVENGVDQKDNEIPRVGPHATPVGQKKKRLRSDNCPREVKYNASTSSAALSPVPSPPSPVPSANSLLDIVNILDSASTPTTTDQDTVTPKRRPKSSKTKPKLSDAQIQKALEEFGSEEEASNDEEEEKLKRLITIRHEPRDDEDLDDVVPETDFSIPTSEPFHHPVAGPDQGKGSEEQAASGSRELMGPSTMFHFEWNGDFSCLGKNPVERREKFEQPTGPTTAFPSPYSAFRAIWTEDIMRYIVDETNYYAQALMTQMWEERLICPNSRMQYWVDTNVDELFVYFGILIAMGLILKGDVTEYWSISQDKTGILDTPNWGKYMTYNRFYLLSKCLHFSRNDRNVAASLSQAEARVQKIKPIVEHLNIQFSALYRLRRHISLDESLTQWKGWLSIRQHIGNKATKIGIKTYEICEAKTGYLWRFTIHTGGAADTPDCPLTGVIGRTVLEMLKGLEHRGHTVWMDNSYNSPALARVLKTRGFDCAGPLRANRQFVPADVSSLTKASMTVGQINACTSGDVDIIVYRDTNKVTMISTYHGPSIFPINEHQNKPTVILDYNLCMGGVERKDQMLAMYPMERKRTAVWYKKLFKRLLNTSILNSYILHRESDIPQTKKIMDHRACRISLMNDIFKHHKKLEIPPPPPSRHHFPKLHDTHQTRSGKEEHIRHRCVRCHKKTTYSCMACDLPMCPHPCMFEYHLAKRLV